MWLAPTPVRASAPAWTATYASVRESGGSRRRVSADCPDGDCIIGVSLSSCVECYNGRRPRFLPNSGYETPLKAFFAKRAAEAIREKNPKWAEADPND